MKNISLTAKWMPSANASSPATIEQGKIIQKKFGLTPKEYRVMLSSLREYLDVVERKLCQKEWKNIDYEKIPSRAAMIYRKAFKKHDPEGYEQYLKDVESGKKEIKSSTLYPYDLIKKVYNNNYDKTISLQWDALPNYVEPFNGLVIVDSSGSMGSAGYYAGYYGGSDTTVRPIDVAISLAIYIAERNKGAWENYFMQFSSDASLCKMSGANIYEKFKSLKLNGHCGSTNLQAAFDKILNTAIKNRIPEGEMPETLFVVSDMEWDMACKSNKRSNFEQIKKKYAEAGYEMPGIVFWNVNAYGGNSPVTVNDDNVALISGCSPSILKSVFSGQKLTPIDIMDETIESERYEAITL